MAQLTRAQRRRRAARIHVAAHDKRVEGLTGIMSCLHPSKLALPKGRPSPDWAWLGIHSRRIRREQRLGRRVAFV